jgi:hypothetical protein
LEKRRNVRAKKPRLPILGAVGSLLDLDEMKKAQKPIRNCQHLASPE